MSFWEILGLEPTRDEAAIKAAYRVQLRRHHPEEDPDGFMQVRQAYEAIITALQHGDSPMVSEPLPPAADHALGLYQQAFEALLADPNKRFVAAGWQAWTDSVAWLDLNHQEQLSQFALTRVLASRWLPGSVIEWLWTGLSWQILLNRDREQVKLGLLLDEWRSRELSLSIDELHKLSEGEQRGLLSFLNPFHQLLNHGHQDGLQHLLNQHTVIPFVDSLGVKVCLLQAFNACHAFPQSGTVALIESLLHQPRQALDVAQWEVVGQACINLNHETGVVAVAHHLMALGASADAADILYQASMLHDASLALCFAFIKQQWQPLPPVYWRSVQGFFPASRDNAEQRRLAWLFAELMGEPGDQFSQRLDFSDQEGFSGLLVQLFWATKHGSWAWINRLSISLLEALPKARGVSELAIKLTLQWGEPLWDKAPGSVSLKEKLAQYDSDALFAVAPLTDAEFYSLSASQWLECVNRHPLMPDSWLARLQRQGVLSLERLTDPQLFSPLSTAICQHRLTHPHVSLASVYLNQPFTGVFDWILYFHAHYLPLALERQIVLAGLPKLDTRQAHGPLALLAELPLLEVEYVPQCWAKLEEFAEHGVCQHWIVAQWQLLNRTRSRSALFEMANQGDVLALLALSADIQRENFDLAVVFWNLFYAATAKRPLFATAARAQQLALRTLRSRLGGEQAVYSVAAPEFLRSLLTRRVDELPKPDKLEAMTPAPQAKLFHFPICYLLVIVHLGIDERGYALSPLKALGKYYARLPTLYQQTTDVAITRLQILYQEALSKDIATRGRRAASFSRVKLQAASISFAGVWLGLLPWIKIHHPLNTALSGAIGLLLVVFHWMLVCRLGRAMVTERMRTQYRWYSICTLLGAGFGHSILLPVLNVLGHVWCACGLTSVFAHGGWERRRVQSGKIDLRKMLGFQSATRSAKRSENVGTVPVDKPVPSLSR